MYDDECRIPPPRFPDVLLRTPPNWTAVAFFAMLGCVHLAIAIPTLLHGRWEGYMGLLFGLGFAGAAAVSTRFRCEVGMQPSRQRIRLSTGVARFRTERYVNFSEVGGVRITLADSDRAARIDILCPCEDIECPPTNVPRQEALLLAMMMGVPLIKVSGGGSLQTIAPEPRRARRSSEAV